MARKSKRVLWEIMRQMEEAGEEDVCSLLNEIMGAQPYFGSEEDLTQYLQALEELETRGELLVREYRIEGGRTAFGNVLTGSETRPADAFTFDSREKHWKWTRLVRQMVELPMTDRA